METAKKFIPVTGLFILMFSFISISGSIAQTGGSKTVQTTTKSVQTKTKSTSTGSKTTQAKPKTRQTGVKSVQTKPKPVQKSSKPEPVKKKTDPGAITIGGQVWSVANLNVGTFRNGDTIPEARSNKEWVEAGTAGKPAWCYYNNDPANGLKYGRLYNWYAMNDPRGLAPEGWSLAGDADWSELSHFLGGDKIAGYKMKSTTGWSDGNNGINEVGFLAWPGGYRVENGTFLNLGSICIWWSTTENNTLSANDHYLALSAGLGRSNSPKQRGESVRCIKH